MPQEAFLFSGTIRDNIAYGRKDASDAEVEAAAREVGAHDFIASLPGGYLQWVSERGRSLSSGQRQLIALARAHLVDPAILLLDEATSNLDLQTEAKVQAAMGVAAHGRTTILIAHRLQTARLADRIVVVDDGRVVEDGSHDELLAPRRPLRRACGPRPKANPPPPPTRRTSNQWRFGTGAERSMVGVPGQRSLVGSADDARCRLTSRGAPGGATACCTRSTRAPTWTRTATASAICAASPRGSTICSGSASTASGSIRSRCRPTRTGATTSPTTAVSIPRSARSPTPTSSIAEAAAARHPGRCSTSFRTTRAISTRGSWTRSRRATSKHRDWYVWADPKPDGSPPNNWVMAFDPRVPAWTFDEASGQYYLNQFLSSQPDLNWWNDDVRDAFDDILRFWFDRGVAGFRIDVCHSIIKDRDLRDNPPATKDDHWWVQMSGQRSVYNASRPEVHDVLRRWRKLADGYDPNRVLIGETYVFDPTELGSFYGNDDELNLAFNFTLLHSKLRRARRCAPRSRKPSSTCPRTRGRCGPAATTTTTGSRHVGAATIPRRRAPRW